MVVYGLHYLIIPILEYIATTIFIICMFFHVNFLTSSLYLVVIKHKGDKKLYWIEVENESTGDIVEKVGKYEGLIWACESNNLPVGCLTIVYKNKRVLTQLKDYSGDIKVRLIHISEFAERWEW